MKVVEFLEELEQYRGEYRILLDKFEPLEYDGATVYLGSGMFAEVIEDAYNKEDVEEMLSRCKATLQELLDSQKKAEKILEKVNQLILDIGLNAIVDEDSVKFYLGALPYEESSRY